MKKPIQLRAIFIMNGLMMILPFVFYMVFTTKNISIDGLENIHMVYTGISYIISFIFLVLSILKRKINALRAMLVINILIAFPADAYIGMLFALISMGLSFSKKVKAYFAS